MRYIGNKEKIVKEIENVINDNIKDKIVSFCDLFSGTGIVGHHFRSKYKIISNDILHSAHVLSHAYLNSEDNIFENLNFDPIKLLNELNGLSGFFHRNFSPKSPVKRMYFSEVNAMKIDAIRTQIESWKISKTINYNQYMYLLASLLESISLRANIAGVYGSFLKHWDSRALKNIELKKLELSNKSAYENVVFNENSINLIKNLSGDILYLDPPYTKNDYSVQYHLLETLIIYDNPVIVGKTGTRKDKVISEFSKKNTAEMNLEKIISESNFKYILLSYNNNGLMSLDFVETLLKKHSSFFYKKIIKHSNYTNKKSLRNKENLEIIYLIKKKDIFIESPLNYMGSKHGVLNILMPKINQFDTFVDLFGGGFNVGINSKANKIYYNEINTYVYNLIKEIGECNIVAFTEELNKLIKKHNLSKANNESYNNYRKYYNSLPKEKRRTIDLYLLSQFSFQQQLRFNSKHDYNNTSGMSSFNTNTLIKLYEFNRKVKQKNIKFSNLDFREFKIKESKNILFFIDPPYLVTLGSYNDGKRGFNGWTVKDESDLYAYVDNIVKTGGKFLLTNILTHNGKKNEILFNWIKTNNFKVEKITHRRRLEIIVSNIG